MLERVLRAEEVARRPHLAHRRHRLLEVGEGQAARIFVPADQLLGIGDELRVAAAQPGLEPARHMPDVVGARQDRRMHQHVGFIARLRIVELGADMEARGAPRQAVFPRQLAHQIHHLRGLRRAAHGRARLHVHRHHELAVDLRASRGGSAG